MTRRAFSGATGRVAIRSVASGLAARGLLAIGLAAIATAIDGTAEAHSSGVPVAYLPSPEGTGTIVDGSFSITWIDSDLPVATGTATVELYYVSQDPPTFNQGRTPFGLEGTPIVTGIPEKDLTNAFVWDTSAVPSGTYWLWSRVREPPSELGTLDIFTFSPGVVTVAHPGDPVPPAVVVTVPDNPFRWADTSYEIGYDAFDPDGTGRVRLEATSSTVGAELMIIADDLPAVKGGRFVWNTVGLPDGDWSIRATITDARGQSFASYGKFFLLIMHASANPPDAGAAPDATEAAPDAGVADDVAGTPGDEKSCGCTTSSARASGGAAGFFALLFAAAVARVLAKRA